jgi:hypothetical protein
MLAKSIIYVILATAGGVIAFKLMSLLIIELRKFISQ